MPSCRAVVRTGLRHAESLSRGDPGERVSQAGELRLASLESVRGLACLAVILTHAVAFVYVRDSGWGEAVWHRLVGAGGFGLALFFTLSGYLIFLPFARAGFGGGPRIDLRRYARNRALRILPLYYVSVAVVGLILLPPDLTTGQALRYLVFAQTLFEDTRIAINAPLWSVVVEIHFYALVPLMAWALVRVSGRSLLRAGGWIFAIGLLSWAFLVYGVGTQVVDHVPENPVLRWSLLANFSFFAPGMLLALLRVHWDRTPPARRLPPLWVWLAAGPALWLLGPVWGGWLASLPLVAVACFAVIGGLVLPVRAGRWRRPLEWWPLVRLGTASYSIYVWHLPILALLFREVFTIEANGYVSGLLVPATFAIAVPVGLLSYALIEVPFLRGRRSWARRATSSSAA